LKKLLIVTAGVVASVAFALKAFQRWDRRGIGWDGNS